MTTTPDAAADPAADSAAAFAALDQGVLATNLPLGGVGDDPVGISEEFGGLPVDRSAEGLILAAIADDDSLIYAKVIADSLAPDGTRITTWEKRHHRWVLAEENTHATPAKNSASSRARPIGKVIDDVRNNPAVPVVWAAEQKGMSGGDSISLEAEAIARRKWDLHREATIKLGFDLRELGVHKSITNRLIEPHSMHVSVWTATAIDNYFAQRVHKDAQPEIRVVAAKMLDAYNASTPVQLKAGEWHLPYISPEDRDLVAQAAERAQRVHLSTWDWGIAPTDERMAALLQEDPLALAAHLYGTEVTLARISAARVARTSYLTQDGKRDLAVDLALYDRLADDRLDADEPPHWSPLEQVATPCPDNRQHSPLVLPVVRGINDRTGNGTDTRSRFYPTRHLPKVGKYTGWISMRHLVEAQRGMVTYR